MSSFFIGKSQGLHFSNAMNFVEQYLQLIIYLSAAGVMGFMYVTLHGMVVKYLGGLDLSQIPNY